MTFGLRYAGFNSREGVKRRWSRWVPKVSGACSKKTRLRASLGLIRAPKLQRR